MKDKKYWRSIEELKTTSIKKHINDNHSIIDIIKNKKISRRDFLKLMGFSTASVMLSACRGKVIKTIPYITKPERLNSTHSVYYASTMFDGFDLSPVLVKTKEGRPIKIKKNSLIQNPCLSSTSPRIQGSLLQLYDNERLKTPYLNNKITDWKKLDNYVISSLNKIKHDKNKIIILTPSLSSPSLKNIILNFIKIYPNARHIIYDHISYNKFLNATKKVLGYRGIPIFNLSQTKFLISFDADFLSDWTPQNMTKLYTDAKNPNKNMLQHIQIESNMTITGANADIRIPYKPSLIKQILINLYNLLLNIETTFINKTVEIIYNNIIKYKNKCLVIADGDEENYILSLLINKKIKSSAINNTFITSKNSNDIQVEKLITNLKTNEIGAIIIYNCNPIYAIYKNISKYFKNIKLKIYCSINSDETAEQCNVLAPIPHWLESWGDANPMTKIYTLMQPTIETIFNTRQFEETLLTWMNHHNTYYYDYMKSYWEKYILPYTKERIFNKALFKGGVKVNQNEKLQNNKPLVNYICNKKKYATKNFELKLYPSYNIGDGTQSNNPWLQEMPDPITKVTWDNCLTISQLDAEKLELKNKENIDGSLKVNMVNLILNKKTLIKNVPVYIQPGQAHGSIGLSMGYGKKDGKISLQSGKINAYSLYINFNNIQYNVILQKINNLYYNLASTQTQHTMNGREADISEELSLNKFLLLQEKNDKKNNQINIWNNPIKNDQGPHFNLSIDLNACIGCNACIIACQIENNIPVVGKNEIIKSRDMQWIRIDRYYTNTVNINNENAKSHTETVNPKVIFQPIMCQHCEHAPCETVCPVGATSHSEQGQNMMTYNRCIGTRYCANNCPYKVRRFNWFKYSQNEKFDFNMNNDLGRMVLNPDVVIRSRGVMEKCSLCIQMTQKTILQQKSMNNNKNIQFETACSQACPTDAITFGNIKDKTSKIYHSSQNKRKYKLLNFLGTKPNVFYLKKVRNNKINKLNNSEK